VPAALTHALIEGIVLAGMAHGTGLALLETHIHARAPVRVGDTIGAEVAVTGIRPTSTGNRAVVTSEITVTNQRGETVMDYTVKRLLAGRP
jgi:acyl dehydratase